MFRAGNPARVIGVERGIGLRTVATDKTQVRREEILEAAVEQLIARGIASVRVADVATSRGISTGLVHYHFATKDQLIAEAFAFEGNRDLAALELILASGVPPRERLSRGLELYGPTGDARGWRIWIDGWSESLRNEALRTVIHDLNGAWVRAIVALLDEGVADGSILVSDTRVTASRILALVDGMSVRAVLWPEEPSTTDLRGWVAEAIAAELGSRD